MEKIWRSIRVMEIWGTGTSPTTEPWSLGPVPWPPWSRWAQGELTVSSPWTHRDNFFLMGWYLEANLHQWFMLWTVWNRPMGPRVIRCTPSISNHLPTLHRLLLIKSTQAMSPTVINVFWCPAWRQAISNHHWRECDLTVTWVILHEPRGVTLDISH